MYIVGLDADTLIVSLNMVTYLLAFGYLLENLYIIKVHLNLKKLSFHNKVQDIIILQLVGKIFNYSYSSLPGGLYNKQSAGNLISEHVPYYYKLNKNDNSKSLLENDELLGYYLAGLIEGDGYIGKREITISIHIKDIQNAYYLKKRIGYGEIKKYSHTNNAVRLSFYTKEARLAVFKLINGKLLGKYKHNQLINQKYDLEFNNTIKPLANFDLLTNP
jgi:hypothetical protein